MSNEAVRIKKETILPAGSLPTLCLHWWQFCVQVIYLAGVIIFEDWRKYL